MGVFLIIGSFVAKKVLIGIPALNPVFCVTTAPVSVLFLAEVSANP